MRIAVAADRLGYDSEASFSRAFKRIIGQSPSATRAPRKASPLPSKKQTEERYTRTFVRGEGMRA